MTYMFTQVMECMHHTIPVGIASVRMFSIHVVLGHFDERVHGSVVVVRCKGSADVEVCLSKHILEKLEQGRILSLSYIRRTMCEVHDVIEFFQCKLLVDDSSQLVGRGPEVLSCPSALCSRNPSYWLIQPSRAACRMGKDFLIEGA
jgi:hypothetical protein